MLNMSHINHIKDLAKSGKKLIEIANETNRDPKTVRKYLKQEDFSPKLPTYKIIESKLDPYKPVIDQWLLDEQHYWYKQRYTAKRIHDRLCKEITGYCVSYPTVARYVRKKRTDEQQIKSFQELVWHPGEAQVDFGEADFYERQQLIRKKYLAVSFPYSNDSFVQVFGGETAECVCQGLLDIFIYIGGVPGLFIFDNATGVGRKIGEKIRETELFQRFRAHYGFSIRFCNPNSGNEKGNVENKVGYTRRNLFVPPESYDDINAFNKTLLDKHTEKAAENHYKKLVPISDLFEEDIRALQPLPSYPFNVCRFETVLADGYGKVRLDEKHRYSTCPEYGGRKILVGIKAHTIEIMTPDHQVLVIHDRRFGEQRTDSMDYRTSLAILMRNVGAWPNSGVREQLPVSLRLALDEQPREELRQSINTLKQLSTVYDFNTAIAALDEGLRLNRRHFCDAAILAARIKGYGLSTTPEQGPDLKIYDQLLKGESPCQ